MRATAVAVLLAAALVGGYVAAGGGDFAPTPVANPCSPRERPRSGDVLDPVQRATLAVLDGAACELGSSRETLLLTLLQRRRPPDVSDARLSAAIAAGVDRAQREGALGGAEAAFLRGALRARGARALLGLLLGS